jgi:hypothetical protein
MCATSVIFKPMPKVNNRPLGENLPNQVTLATVTDDLCTVFRNF